MKRPLSTAARFVVLLSVFVGACSEAESAPVQKDVTCTRETDCAPELTCRAGKCEPQCEASEDCEAGLRCVVFEQEHSCVEPSEQACASPDDCQEPLGCAPDNECRALCETSADCLKSELCAKQGFCARSDEVDAENRLPAALD